MNRILLIIIIFYFMETWGQRTSAYFPSQQQSTQINERQFRVIYEWKTIDFAFHNDRERSYAIQTEKYIPTNVIISDIKAFAGRLYLSLPRMLPGVPATLGWIVSNSDSGVSNPEIEPFPSWSMNDIGNCSALQFVQSMAIDSDGVMWIVDSGRVNSLSRVPDLIGSNCPPKLLLLDLKQNGALLLRYEFPEDVVAKNTNYLNKIVMDDAYGGYAYITDNSALDPGIVVFSRRLKRSWKIRENNSMRAARNAAGFSINGTYLEFSIHIDGIALGPYYDPKTGDTLTINSPQFANNFYERNVYYCPLSSYHLYSIPASILRDPEFSRRASPRELFDLVTDHGVKLSQTDGMIMDNRGILYYGLLKEHAIAQWDSYKPFLIENQKIIAKDENFIHWVDGMSFDEQGYFYVVVNRLHNFVAQRLDPFEINFRILRAKTGSLSYVYTNGFGAGNIGVDPSTYQSDGFISDNRISSSTPTLNSLVGYNPYYSDSPRNTLSVCVQSLILFVVALLLY